VLPEWIAQPVSARPGRGPGRLRFLEAGLRETGSLITSAVFAERAARQPGFLQALDARVKLVSLVALVVTASFLHHLPSLWLLALCVAAVALTSRLGARLLFHRVWWFLPATFVLLALPAVFSVITPGDPLLVLYHTDTPAHIGSLGLPAELTITRQGTASAALLLSRLFVGVLLAVTLTLTTRWQELLKAAHNTVSAPFIFTLAMMHRYLFVLLRMFENMHLAAKARTISAATLREQHRWIGGRIGALFSHSRQLGEQVYAAMLARGYRGTPKPLRLSRFGRQEAAWSLACLALACLCIWLDRSLLGGLPW